MWLKKLYFVLFLLIWEIILTLNLIRLWFQVFGDASHKSDATGLTSSGDSAVLEKGWGEVFFVRFSFMLKIIIIYSRGIVLSVSTESQQAALVCWQIKTAWVSPFQGTWIVLSLSDLCLFVLRDTLLSLLFSLWMDDVTTWLMLAEKKDGGERKYYVVAGDVTGSLSPFCQSTIVPIRNQEPYVYFFA